MAVDGAQEARAHAKGAEMWGTATDGAREARAHVMGAETRGTAADGAREARAYAMGAETWGTAGGHRWGQGWGRDTGGTEGWRMGPCERCERRRDACDGNVHPEGPGLRVARARRPRTRAVLHVEAAAGGEAGDGT